VEDSFVLVAFNWLLYYETQCCTSNIDRIVTVDKIYDDGVTCSSLKITHLYFYLLNFGQLPIHSHYCTKKQSQFFLRFRELKNILQATYSSINTLYHSFILNAAYLGMQLKVILSNLLLRSDTYRLF